MKRMRHAAPERNTGADEAFRWALRALRTGGRSTLLGAALAGTLVSGLGLDSPRAAAQGLRLEQVATQSSSLTSWRLSDQDMDLYSRIFSLQGEGHWDAAAALIPQVQDPLLMGYVHHQRLMASPQKARLTELRDWLDSYADLPMAEIVYSVAQGRMTPSRPAPKAAPQKSSSQKSSSQKSGPQKSGPQKAAEARKGAAGKPVAGKKDQKVAQQPPPPPVKAEPPVVLRSPASAPRFNAGGTGESMSALWELAGTYSSSQSQKAAALWAKFRTALGKQPTTQVARTVDTKEVASTLTALDHDRMRGTLAYALFVEGNDEEAVEWAEKAVARSGDRMSMALWAGGLAHWRQGRYDQARDWFARLARSSDSSPWLTAGGAFWASRAALRTGRPEEVSYWLNEAAKETRTFYGLTARRALGLPLSFAWEGDFLSAADSETLGRTAAGRRALALAQLGRIDYAEEELRRLYAVVDERTKDAIVRMADISGMASFALGLASYRSRTDEGSVSVTDAARYPVPFWEPEDGWRLDRALLYAFIRQESAFNPEARSVAGAQGLMQMMPATARLVASWDGNANGWLTGSKTVMVPEVNMSLGQKYLETLLAQPEVDGNLFFAAAAYNAGPGNLAKWQKRVQYNDDPLLFIEAIPSRETRLYIERVVANLWIYADRLGQPAPSLDHVAGGAWPRYVPTEQGGARVAQARKPGS
ncbi:hypothetical protein GCM10027256_14850 [Novispirillum itersonii subsp. nipponicum]